MDEFDPFSEVSFFLLVAYRYYCMCSLFCPEVTFRFLLIVTVVLFFFFFFLSQRRTRSGSVQANQYSMLV